MGRPTKYTPELGAILFEHISTSSLGLKRICKLPDVNMDASTLRDWIADKDHPFSTLYARAKKIQIDLLFEEIIDIADDATNDLMKTIEGDEYENKEFVNRSKLRIDARKWQLAKLNPHKYGDKVTLGSDPDNPLPAGNNTIIYLPAKGSMDAPNIDDLG